jgi:hypothetical protein
MQKALFVVCLSCLLTSLAVAQTKISGTFKCGKATTEQKIPVGDHPDHFFGVSQGSCTSTKPWTVAGVASKAGVGTSTLEANGEVAKTRGVYVDSMENGDKAIYRVEATVTTKDAQVQVTGHKWQLVEGTGKLKGVKGQGTCKASGTADEVTYECEGEYTLPK